MVVDAAPTMEQVMASGLLDPLQAKAYEGTRHLYSTSDDEAHDFTVPEDKPFVPTPSIRESLAATILGGEASQLYGLRDNGTRLRREGVSGAFAFCMDFGECGASDCGCNRLNKPDIRRRFRDLVVTRTDEALRSAQPGADLPGVRLVTLGAGALLTDFEILLGLWSRGLRIESVIAIDSAYDASHEDSAEYHRALSALAVFFSPARVTAFSSASAYEQAAARSPHIYARANALLYCDAASVPPEIFRATATAALLPGFCAFELANTAVVGKSGHGLTMHNAPLASYLPPELRPKPGDGKYSMRVLRRSASNDAAGLSGSTLESNGSAGTGDLVDVVDPMISERERGLSWRARDEALHYLQRTTRSRAAQAGKRVFTVVWAGGPRMAVRSEPSRCAPLAGSRERGDEVIVDEVRRDGWVRLSPLDAFAGWEHTPNPGKFREVFFMLTQAEDVGELLREVVLDANVDMVEASPEPV